MQVNQTSAGLLSLHKAYNRCLEAKVDAWLKHENPSVQADRSETEFCMQEKRAYLNYMKVNTPVEYNNIMRLEEGSY